MRFIAVFCGSGLGKRDVYRQAAAEVGRLLVAHGRGLVYGGGSVGLMGVVADSVLERGGSAIGVLPKSMARSEVAHQGLTRLEIVEGMHPRKARMAQLCEAFLALPGGFGTFEELLEATTWLQLGYHRSPIGLLNVDGYFDPFLEMIDRAVDQGFIRPCNRNLIAVHDSPARLLEDLLSKVTGEPGIDESRI